MAENTSIEWADHTFNPWIGCTNVSAACDNCYAEAWSDRFAPDQWGPHAARRRTSPANWAKPVRWNKALEGTGRRQRVFCASLADVFDNHRSIEDQWRWDLWKLIDATPNLDWLLLTKRPQNVMRFAPRRWGVLAWPNNIWIGATVENQDAAERTIGHLVNLPAKVLFLSCEPLLGPLDISAVFHMGDRFRVVWPLQGQRIGADRMPQQCNQISWVITGGESGSNFRPVDPDWFRSLRDQCAAHGVPFLFKQWEGKTQKQIKALGRELDGVIHDGYPLEKAWPRGPEK